MDQIVSPNVSGEGEGESGAVEAAASSSNDRAAAATFFGPLAGDPNPPTSLSHSGTSDMANLLGGSSLYPRLADVGESAHGAAPSGPNSNRASRGSFVPHLPPRSWVQPPHQSVGDGGCGVGGGSGDGFGNGLGPLEVDLGVSGTTTPPPPAAFGGRSSTGRRPPLGVASTPPLSQFASGEVGPSPIPPATAAGRSSITEGNDIVRKMIDDRLRSRHSFHNVKDYNLDRPHRLTSPLLAAEEKWEGPVKEIRISTPIWSKKSMVDGAFRNGGPGHGEGRVDGLCGGVSCMDGIDGIPRRVSSGGTHSSIATPQIRNTQSRGSSCDYFFGTLEIRTAPSSPSHADHEVSREGGTESDESPHLILPATDAVAAAGRSSVRAVKDKDEKKLDAWNRHSFHNIADYHCDWPHHPTSPLQSSAVKKGGGPVEEIRISTPLLRRNMSTCDGVSQSGGGGDGRRGPSRFLVGADSDVDSPPPPPLPPRGTTAPAPTGAGAGVGGRAAPLCFGAGFSCDGIGGSEEKDDSGDDDEASIDLAELLLAVDKAEVGRDLSAEYSGSRESGRLSVRTEKMSNTSCNRSMDMSYMCSASDLHGGGGEGGLDGGLGNIDEGGVDGILHRASSGELYSSVATAQTSNTKNGGSSDDFSMLGAVRTAPSSPSRCDREVEQKGGQEREQGDDEGNEENDEFGNVDGDDGWDLRSEGSDMSSLGQSLCTADFLPSDINRGWRSSVAVLAEAKVVEGARMNGGKKIFSIEEYRQSEEDVEGGVSRRHQGVGAEGNRPARKGDKRGDDDADSCKGSGDVLDADNGSEDGSGLDPDDLLWEAQNCAVLVMLARAFVRLRYMSSRGYTHTHYRRFDINAYLPWIPPPPSPPKKLSSSMAAASGRRRGRQRSMGTTPESRLAEAVRRRSDLEAATAAVATAHAQNSAKIRRRRSSRSPILSGISSVGSNSAGAGGGMNDLSSLGDGRVCETDDDTCDDDSMFQQSSMKTTSYPRYLLNTRTAAFVVRTALAELPRGDDGDLEKEDTMGGDNDDGIAAEFHSMADDFHTDDLENAATDTILELRKMASRPSWEREYLRSSNQSIASAGKRLSLVAERRARAAVLSSVQRRRPMLAMTRSVLKSGGGEGSGWAKLQRRLVEDHFGVTTEDQDDEIMDDGSKLKKNNTAVSVESRRNVQEAVTSDVVDDAIEAALPSYFRGNSVLSRVVRAGVELAWLGDRNEATYCIYVCRTTRVVTVVFLGPVRSSWSLAVAGASEVENPLAGEEYDGRTDTLRIHRVLATYLHRKRKDDGRRKIDEIIQKVWAIGQELSFDGRYRMIVVGHGWGGALAAIFGMYAASELAFGRVGVMQPLRVVTFGSPRVGDAAFAAACGHLERTGRLLHARYANCGDLVPLLPAFAVEGMRFGSSFKHVGLQVRLFEAKHLETDGMGKTLDLSYAVKEDLFPALHRIWDGLLSNVNTVAGYKNAHTLYTHQQNLNLIRQVCLNFVSDSSVDRTSKKLNTLEEYYRIVANIPASDSFSAQEPTRRIDLFFGMFSLCSILLLLAFYDRGTASQVLGTTVALQRDSKEIESTEKEHLLLLNQKVLVPNVRGEDTDGDDTIFNNTCAKPLSSIRDISEKETDWDVFSGVTDLTTSGALSLSRNNDEVLSSGVDVVVVVRSSRGTGVQGRSEGGSENENASFENATKSLQLEAVAMESRNGRNDASDAETDAGNSKKKDLLHVSPFRVGVDTQPNHRNVPENRLLESGNSAEHHLQSVATNSVSSSLIHESAISEHYDLSVDNQHQRSSELGALGGVSAAGIKKDIQLGPWGAGVAAAFITAKCSSQCFDEVDFVASLAMSESSKKAAEQATEMWEALVFFRNNGAKDVAKEAAEGALQNFKDKMKF